MKINKYRIIWWTCFLAPMALVFPKAVAPSKIPGALGLGNWSFFLHWLTKYPNFHGINLEVGLGILCLLGVALIPPLWALLRIRQQYSIIANVLALMYAAFLVAVIYRLDILLYVAGYYTMHSDILRGVYIMAGPILHSLPALAILVYYSLRLIKVASKMQ